MTNQQGAPEALRLADRLSSNTGHVGGPTMDAAAAELRRLHAENERLAALVEAQQPATHVQNPAEIAHVAGDVSKNGAESNMAQRPAPSAAAALPEGWVPLVITHEGQYPEEVAYGPQILMDRLGKWLRKYFDHVVASKAQPTPTPQADSQPAPDERDDFEKVFPLPSGCVRVGTGYASTGYSNWAAHTHCERWQGWQARASRAPAESVLEDAARLERERICAAIKAEDDYCVDQGDYMLDSDDCIKIVRGEWVRPDFAIDAARKQGGAT